MVIFITGSTHTGKTALAQKLLEKYHIPYLSEDHLKMGLIRSGNTSLTPEDDALLTDYLWPIVKEMAKTAIENEQDLIIEGCYIPLDYKKDLSSDYLENIKFICLVMSEDYIEHNFDDIKRFSCVVEKRLYDDFDKQTLIKDNRYFKENCEKNGVSYIMINESYDFDVIL